MSIMNKKKILTLKSFLVTILVIIRILDSDLINDNSRNKKTSEYDDSKNKNKIDGENSKQTQNTQTKENKNPSKSQIN